MKKFLLCLLTFILVSSLSAQQDTIGTGTIAANTSTSSGSGAVFNLHAKNAIHLTEIGNTINSSVTGYEIWYNTDSVVGQPTINAANGWVLHETGSLTPAATGFMYVQLNNPLLITAGETYGIYFRVLGSSLRFTSEANFGTTTFSDGNVRMNVGGTSGCVFILPNSYLNTYCFVGDIVYELAITSPNDATVLAVDSPNYFCAGMKDIYATVANYGINQIDSVEIHWEFNGVAQPTVHYKQTLDTITGFNPYSATVFLGSGSFPTGVENTIKVWTSQPNGLVDTINRNDTMEVVRKAALVGNYTLNSGLPASMTNYQSFTDLAADLNAFGVCGAVNVTVASGLYTDVLKLGKIGGTSATNTITIDGVDSSIVTLTNNASTSGSPSTIALEGSEYVTIKNMTIESTFTGYTNATVLKLNNANHNTITNNRLLADSTSTYSVVYNIDMSGSYNIISNNLINGGGYYGFSMEASGVDVHNQILNNEIYNMYYYGLRVRNQDSIEIIGNTIDISRRDNQRNYGLYMYYSTNAKINRNHINGNGYGIYYYNYNTFAPVTRKIEINNNMIISEGPGLFFYYLDSVDILHNSISSTVSSPAVQINAYSSRPSANFDVRNNIFSSRFGEAFVTNYPTTMFDSLDNNLYYTTGNNLLTIDATDYATLADFQTAFPLLNVNAIEGDPQFVDPASNLHILGSLADDAGDNTVGIGIDIDGDPRPMTGSTIVDIGADEYDAPLCPPLYGLSASNPSLDSVTISWIQGSGSYQYEVVTAGQAQGSGTTVSTTLESLRIGGLSAATAYEFYVRQICGAGDTSMWWGPFEFYTASPLVYFENFDNFPSTELSNGWSNTSYSAPYWSVDDVANSANGYAYGGPAMDHTTGSDKFAYYTVDYSAGTSSMISPLIYVDSNRSSMKLSFWYHMYGADMGTMNVYIDSNGVSNLITSISGQQQFSETDPWLEFTTYLTGYQGKYVQLRFEGSKSTGYYSAMAIDDVMLDTVPPLNVAVAELISPSGAICPGTVSPILGVLNTGQSAIDSVMVYWEVNGVLDSVLYTTSITSGDTAHVTLGSITLNGTTFYDIKFYVKNPNSTMDPFPLDDSLSFNNLRTGLFRSYTIDPVIPSSFSVFNSISEAADALANYGVCGAVDFTIAAGTYNEAVVLGEISGASATNTILFDGQDSSATTISHNGSSQYATWTFNGADYVTLKNVTVENTNTSEGASVLFAAGADHNTVSNSELKVSPTSSTSNITNVLFSGSIAERANGVRADYNTIANNKVDGGYYGVYMYASNSEFNHHTSILENEFSNQYYYGIYAYYADSTDVIGNHIDMTRNSNAYGLNFTFSANIKLNENYIHAGRAVDYMEANGYVMNTRVMEMNNNMLISDNGDGLNLYLNMRNQATIEILHTSVSSEDEALDLTLYGPLATFDIRNSILKSTSAAAITSNNASTNFGPMDNNIYYTTSGTNLFEFTGANHPDLASFQTALPALNINSLEGDPQFRSPSDLHIIGTFANDKGDNGVGIFTDIDGDNRPMTGSTFVDIGADEFDPPSCPPVLNMSASNPSGSSITLEWDGLFTDFEYEIVGKGDPQGTGSSSVVSSDSVRAGGLAPLTDYDFYVREICGRGDTSIWWGPVSFTTGDPMNDLALISLANPTSQTDSCYTANNAVELVIENVGNLAIDFTTDTVDVTVVVSGAVSQTFNYQLNSNLLNSGNPLGLGNSITLPMGNLDMTTAGTYDFKAYLSADIDTLNMNDSLTESISNNPLGGSLDVSNTVCGSGTVTLSTVGSAGELQWQRLVGSSFMDELGADSTSYSVFIDSTTTFRVAACGTEYSDTITVRPDVLPAMPNTTSDTAIVFCGDSGTAVLSATTGLANATINWYSDSSSTSVLLTGDTLYYGLQTSSQSVTTAYTDTFYVSVVDPVNGCVSEMAMVSGTVLCTVGAMEMPSTAGNISIRPNPSRGVFNLVGSNIGEKVSVSIYSTSGKMVYQMENKVSNDFNEQIDLSGLSKGIYFIRLQGEQSMEVMKVVIQ